MTALTIEQLTSNSDVAPFWRAVQERRFTVQRCAACEQARFAPRLVCPFCGSTDAFWTEDAGIGTVYSVTTVMRPVYDDGPPPPYQVVIAELDIGITYLARAADGESLDVDDRVRIGFEGNEKLVVPVFERMPKEEPPRAGRHDLKQEDAEIG